MTHTVTWDGDARRPRCSCGQLCRCTQRGRSTCCVHGRRPHLGPPIYVEDLRRLSVFGTQRVN